MAVEQLTCTVCNEQFNFVTRPGRKPNKCSKECRDERDRSRARAARKRKPPSGITKTMRTPCEGCGKKGVRTTNGLCKFCSPISYKGLEAFRTERSGDMAGMPLLTTLARRIPECECVVCGEVYKPKKGDRTTACSRACGIIWTGAKQAAHSTGLRLTVSVKRRRCIHCSASFEPKGSEHYCGSDCRAAEAQEKISEGYVARAFCCEECGVGVETVYGDKRSTYCSKACQKRAMRRSTRHRGRARLKRAFVESVNPNKVFERDGWRCQQCGCKTPRSKRGSYSKNAPELDHVMPLSLGGEHSYRNTQCLCRACNGAKSNTPMGQLSLL